MDVPRSAGQPTVDRLRVEARYDRDRLALYRARALTGKPTTQMRMQALERAAASSELRLRGRLAATRQA